MNECLVFPFFLFAVFAYALGLIADTLGSVVACVKGRERQRITCARAARARPQNNSGERDGATAADRHTANDFNNPTVVNNFVTCCS